MGRRGRPPATKTGPTPAPAGGPIKPPLVRIDPIASQMWDQVIDQAGGRLQPVDATVLEAYCAAYSLYAACRSQLLPRQRTIDPATGEPLRGAALRKARESPWPLTCETAAGGEKVNPLVTQMQSAWRDVMKFAAELQLTPNSETPHLNPPSGGREAM